MAGISRSASSPLSTRKPKKGGSIAWIRFAPTPSSKKSIGLDKIKYPKVK